MTLHSLAAVALLFAAAAQAAAPSYTVGGIVNASNFTPGPFAPNSIVSIFGTGLTHSGEQTGLAWNGIGSVPLELNYSRVFVDDSAVPLLFVSATQVNFLVPSRQSLGPAVLRVTSDG